jgi:NAD(P)-dependent dehydrogenase (short-subunit alcohol dehydrogenase family)
LSRLAHRVALVTGASRGIGRAVAIGLAHAGAHVIASARTKGALEELDDEIRAAGGSCSLLPLNLKHAAKLDALGPNLYQRWKHLDIFVAAAADLGTLGPLSHTQDADWDTVMSVNLSANWRLLRTLDPLLRQSDAGRALFLSSHVASHPRAYWGAYAVSKAALEAMVRIYAEEVQSTSVRANMLDPGATRTAMRARAYPGEDAMGLKPPDAVVPAVLDMVAPEYDRNGELIRFDAWRAGASAG